MAKKKDEDKSTIGQIQEDVTQRTRDVWLAGLGALASVEKEGTKLFSDLVSKGQEREKEGKEQLDEVYSKVQEGQEKVTNTLEESFSTVEGRLEGLLQKFGYTTQSEVDDLTKKIDKLSDRVEKLAQQIETEKSSGSKSKSSSSSTASKSGSKS